MQYRLRTLLILMAFLPPTLAVVFDEVGKYHRHQQGVQRLREIGIGMKDYSGVLRSAPKDPNGIGDYDG
jgi:hypothetical protein